MKHLFLLILLLVSCGKQNSKQVKGVEMGMAYKILIKEQITEDTLTKVKHIASETFDEVNRKLNHWNSDSEISIWNKSKTTEKVEVSPFLLGAIKIADHVFNLSDGLFDPSTGKVIHLWKMALRTGRTLSDKEIELYKPCCGWDKVVIHENALQKKHPEVEIDLDGITKGYLCDVLTERLKELGLKHFLVEWAGEIKTVGGPFRILSGKDIILLENKAIATSAPTYQIYSIDDRLYSHFVDPKSLKSIEVKDVYSSKSVINDSCALADGLATAALLK